MSLKQGLPLYIVGIFLTTIGILFLSYFSVGYITLVPVFVLIVAGLVLYLGWMLHFDKDKKEFYNGSAGRGRTYTNGIDEWFLLYYGAKKPSIHPSLRARFIQFKSIQILSPTRLNWLIVNGTIMVFRT